MSAHVVLIDNYDSFTWNLAQLFQSQGARVSVVRNDALDLAGVLALRPSHIVLSPGPGTPDKRRDFGVCTDIVREALARVPILGVCLGHQGIAQHLGGQVVRAPLPVHGKTVALKWCGAQPGGRLLQGLPDGMLAMRYHSWIVAAGSLPAQLEVTARTADGLIMAIQHVTLPVFGVQFHPESIGTPLGNRIAQRFLAQTRVGAREDA